MQGTLAERALVGLGDYLFELETGNKSKGRPSYGTAYSTRAEQETKPDKPPSPPSKAAEFAAIKWEHDRVQEWRAHGRITADGSLRVSRGALNPYTLQDLMRVMSHLTVFDRLAALIDLNGVVEEGYLSSKEHENIREVVEKIADERIARQLQEGDATLRLRDLIRLEVAAIFGELRALVDHPAHTISGAKGKGRERKCGKCHLAGHTARTCGRKNADAEPPEEDADA